jgi:hypothetical protein
MAANQNHGEIFEDEIVQKVTGLTKAEYDKTKFNGYTSPWDIDEPHPIMSIKTTSGDGIGGGDIERFYDSVNPNTQQSPWTMVIGRYSQVSDDFKEVQRVYEFYIDPKLHYDLFWAIPKKEISEFAEYVRTIPEGKQAQLTNIKLWKEKRKTLFEQYGKKLANIDAKIDSGAQRRTQCSVKISDLLSSGIPYTIYDKEYLGIPLPYSIKSTRRKRNKPNG